MAERDCAGRIAELSRRLRGLEARATQTRHRSRSPDEELRALQAHVREVIETGDPPARKALLRALVEEICVVSRAEIYPCFSLPAVRLRQGQRARQDSNLRLLPPEGSALSTELRARGRRCRQRTSYAPERLKDIGCITAS